MHLPPFASMVRVLGDPQVLLVLILYPWTCILSPPPTAW